MLNAFAPINTLGTGTHSYNLLRAYDQAGYGEVCLIPPFGQIEFEDEHVSKWLKNRAKFERENPSLMIFDIPFFFNFSGSPKIGFAVFETDGFTPIQKAALRSCDWLMTPSEWGKNVLWKEGFGNVTVVPEGFNPETFTPSTINPANYRKMTYVNVGKLEERKGTLSLLRCFTAALEDEEAVLWLHAQNRFFPIWGQVVLEELCRMGYRSLNGTDFIRERLEVKVMQPGMSANSLATLLRLVDCGIFPTKGEGFGLPIMECLASGTPVICGAWTAMGDYLGPDYPDEILLKESEIHPANDGIWYWGDRGNWHVPNPVEIIERIRWAHKNVRELKTSESWTKFVLELRAKWTWEKAAVRLNEALAEIG